MRRLRWGRGSWRGRDGEAAVGFAGRAAGPREREIREPKYKKKKKKTETNTTWPSLHGPMRIGARAQEEISRGRIKKRERERDKSRTEKFPKPPPLTLASASTVLKPFRSNFLAPLIFVLCVRFDPSSSPTILLLRNCRFCCQFILIANSKY